MRKFLVLPLLSLVLTGCATSQQLAERDKEIATMRDQVQALQNELASSPGHLSHSAQEQNASAPGCPLAGQFYTPGSIIAGRICIGTVNGNGPWRWVVHL